MPTYYAELDRERASRHLYESVRFLYNCIRNHKITFSMALPILDQFVPDQVVMLHTMLQVITRKSPSKKDFKICTSCELPLLPKYPEDGRTRLRTWRVRPSLTQFFQHFIPLVPIKLFFPEVSPYRNSKFSLIIKSSPKFCRHLSLLARCWRKNFTRKIGKNETRVVRKLSWSWFKTKYERTYKMLAGLRE